MKKSTKRALGAMVFLAILAWHHAGEPHGGRRPLKRQGHLEFALVAAARRHVDLA